MLSRILSRRILLATSLILPLALLVSAEMLIILHDNDVFSYTVDDAYIHLALADRIQSGFYGINHGEFSAPSSSILWPLMLSVIPSTTPGWAFFPLVISIASAILITISFAQLVRVTGSASPIVELCLGASIAIALNLTAIVLSGMEHTLQAALTVVGISGLVEAERTGRIPPLAIAALILGPLVRYENFAITIPACVYLLVVGKWRLALIILGSASSCAIAFSAFLVMNGLSFLSTSILSKMLLYRTMVETANYRGPVDISTFIHVLERASQMNFFQGLILRLRWNFMNKQAWILLLLTVPVFARLVVPRCPSDRRLASLCLAAVALHLVGGIFDRTWYFGYETYIFSTVLLVALILYQDRVAEMVRHLSGTSLHARKLMPVAALSLTLILFHGYVGALFTIPTAASYNYLENVQLARFSADYWRRPIGVEPLGTAMWNHNYILDCWGLGSYDVLSALRTIPIDPLWMAKLAKRHDIGLVVIHTDVFVPRDWVLIARLHWTKSVPMGYPIGLRFYATSTATASDIRWQLQKFGRTLPSEAWLAFAQ